MNISHPIVKEFSEKTGAILAALKQELGGVRANRPTPALLENVRVEAYGQTMTVQQVASISIVPPRELALQVWDKSVIAAVAKALETASLGLSISVDGAVIRAFLPELSEERRQELIRHVRKQTEHYRIQVRGARDEANKRVAAARESGEAGEDQAFALKEAVQRETEARNGEIEAVFEAKVREIER